MSDFEARIQLNTQSEQTTSLAVFFMSAQVQTSTQGCLSAQLKPDANLNKIKRKIFVINFGRNLERIL